MAISPSYEVVVQWFPTPVFCNLPGLEHLLHLSHSHIFLHHLILCLCLPVPLTTCIFSPSHHHLSVTLDSARHLSQFLLTTSLPQLDTWYLIHQRQLQIHSNHPIWSAFMALLSSMIPPSLSRTLTPLFIFPMHNALTTDAEFCSTTSI